jgi:hypothetical protein
MHSSKGDNHKNAKIRWGLMGPQMGIKCRFCFSDIGRDLGEQCGPWGMGLLFLQLFYICKYPIVLVLITQCTCVYLYTFTFISRTPCQF